MSALTRTVRRAVNPLSTAVSAAVQPALRRPLGRLRTTPRVRVPDVLGLDVASALVLLGSSGLVASPPADARTSEIVSRQYPDPGARLPRGARVWLWCDGGPDGVREPRRPLPHAGQGAAAAEPAD
jgi:hypothetical protein